MKKFTPKLVDINKLINQWRCRKLAPIGRLEIIKLLISPKLNHLILSTHNPEPDYFSKKNSKMIYCFLWGGKLYKISKATIIEDYRYGGLKMIDYPELTTKINSF